MQSLCSFSILSTNATFHRNFKLIRPLFSSSSLYFSNYLRLFGRIWFLNWVKYFIDGYCLFLVLPSCCLFYYDLWFVIFYYELNTFLLKRNLFQNMLIWSYYFNDISKNNSEPIVLKKGQNCHAMSSERRYCFCMVRHVLHVFTIPLVTIQSR